jgi:hypothetical protein
MTSASGIDTGTGYGRKRPIHDARLTEVGPGTPMGEAMRRYWHPIAVSSALTNDVPHRTRVLGENLIVFRDGKGRAGVVFERCAHRGSSLYYGRIEDDGILAATTAGSMTSKGTASNKHASPMAAAAVILAVNLGIRLRSAMAWCLCIWALPAASRPFRAMTAWNRLRREINTSPKCPAR